MKTYKITAQAHCMMTYYVEAMTALEAEATFRAKPKEARQGPMSSPIITGGINISEMKEPLWDHNYEMAMRNKMMVDHGPKPDELPEERDDRQTDERAEAASIAIIAMITALTPFPATNAKLIKCQNELIAAMRALMTRSTGEPEPPTNVEFRNPQPFDGD